MLAEDFCPFLYWSYALKLSPGQPHVSIVFSQISMVVGVGIATVVRGDLNCIQLVHFSFLILHASQTKADLRLIAIILQLAAIVKPPAMIDLPSRLPHHESSTTSSTNCLFCMATRSSYPNCMLVFNNTIFNYLRLLLPHCLHIHLTLYQPLRPATIAPTFSSAISLNIFHLSLTALISASIYTLTLLLICVFTCFRMLCTISSHTISVSTIKTNIQVSVNYIIDYINFILPITFKTLVILIDLICALVHKRTMPA